MTSPIEIEAVAVPGYILFSYVISNSPSVHKSEYSTFAVVFSVPSYSASEVFIVAVAILPQYSHSAVITFSLAVYIYECSLISSL